MRIPEAYICDAEGCMEDAEYRITHEMLLPPAIPGRMVYGRDWNRQPPLVFTFCGRHATDFSISGRGAWAFKLKLGAPEGS
jgi:hypothetical protein